MAGRLRLRTVLILVNLIVLALPVAGIQVLRIYESALVRQTESELIAQGEDVGKFKREQRYMIELAANNVTHFSGVAVRTYAKWHARALNLARDKNRLWEALHYEALALHSFTDLFAFGHMNQNRKLSNELIQKSKRGNFGFEIVGAVKGFFADL